MPELGNSPIEERYAKQMNVLAKVLDKALNTRLKGTERKTGFILLVFPMNDHQGRCDYIASARREDIITLLKEQLARIEGQPEREGRA